MALAIFFALVGCIGFVLGVCWLMLGRQVSTVFDRCFPGAPAVQSTDPMLIQFDRAGVSSRFTLGSESRALSWPGRPWQFELRVLLDAKQRLMLCAGVKSFTLGPVQTRWADPVKPRYQFVQEAGDVVSFSRVISRLPWPTPFTFSWMGVPVPKLKRYAYDRLRWNKPSGARLEIIWRDEYWFYPRTGWTDTYMNRLYSVRVRV